MTRLLLIISISLLLAACGQSPATSADNTGTTDNNTLEIKEPCAILFNPGGDKLQVLQSDFGEKKFPEIVQFNRATMAADSLYLVGKKVKVISTSATQLKFVRRDGQILYIGLNHAKYAWEIFLFNGLGDPVKADLGDIASAYEEAGFK